MARHDRIGVGIFSRISYDPQRRSLSYARQEEACRRHAEDQGWVVVGTPYREAGTSISKPGVRRQTYERMINDIRAGAIQGIVVWKIDRLLRSVVELDRVLPLVGAAGGFIVALKDHLDTRRPEDGDALRAYVWVAERESRNNAERQQIEREERARSGRAGGSGSRPFGLTASRDGIVDSEAALLREAADRVLEGDWTWSELADDWFVRGVRGTSGRPLHIHQIRRILASPRMVALRVYKGVIVGQAPHPPILDKRTWERVRDLPTREVNRWEIKPEFLLTGLVRCGLCGMKMRGARHQPKGQSAVSQYSCPSGTSNLEACGRVHARQSPVERLAIARALSHLAQPHVLDSILNAVDRRGGTVAAATRTIHQQEERIFELERARTDDTVPLKDYEAAIANAQRRMACAREAIRVHRTVEADGIDPSMLPGGSLTELERCFERMTTPEKRAVLRLLLRAVTIQPAARKARAFDPLRVTIVVQESWSARSAKD